MNLRSTDFFNETLFKETSDKKIDNITEKTSISYNLIIFKGKTFAITGTIIFNGHPISRNTITEVISKLGATVDTIKPTTDYLIQGLLRDPSTIKLNRAIQYKIPIISAEQLFHYLREKFNCPAVGTNCNSDCYYNSFRFRSINKCNLYLI